MIAALCSTAIRRNRSITAILARAKIEGCRRLVGKNNARLVGKRACDRHPLCFATGELLGQSMFAVTNFEIVEQLNGAGAGGSGADARKIEHDSDVVTAVEERQQIRVLKDEPNLVEQQPTQIGFEPALVIDDIAVERDAATARLQNAEPIQWSSVVLPEPLGPISPTT